MSNRKKSEAPQGDDRADARPDRADEVSQSNETYENQAGNAGEAADAEERDAGSDSAGVSAQEGASEVDALNARIDELEQELSDLKDQYLRKQADFENFRKRMLREKDEAIAYANKQLLLDMVSVIDDFERAIQSAEESRDFDSFHDGIVLIEKQLVGMLERKWGLKRFDSSGEPFDPQRHEALMTEEISGHNEPVVLEDFQKGYLLHDRVLRSAKVKVSMPAAK
ncbi:MAG: nucleotide exchange factor GrpE [Spirochaetaceae bacterium]|nr:MAG: nucleotide exchange factor GrpE [Spirochaetaceae bacterium]